MHRRIAIAHLLLCACCACDAVKAPPPQPFAQDLVMPKGSGFFSQTKNLGLQGSWYWFDEGPEGDLLRVRIDVPKTESSGGDPLDEATESLIWFDWEDASRQNFTNPNTVRRICVEGDVTQLLALGFEVCSTKRDQRPYEFPAPLGLCVLNEPTYAARRFRGVAYDIELESPAFFKIETEFKQWGMPSAPQPKCSVYRDPEDADENEVPCAVTYLDSSKQRIRITADATALLSEVQLSRLQAVHVMVYKENQGEKAPFKYCLSRVYAQSDRDVPAGDTDDVPAEPFDTVCSDAGTVQPWAEPDTAGIQQIWHEGDTDLEPMTVQWLPLVQGGAPAGWIMKTEVTVGAYRACVDAEDCDPIAPNWESCDGSDEGVILGDPQWSERAVNCVTWCQAERFCSQLGGRLPMKSEWIAALNQRGGAPAALRCPDIVMQDEELGYGSGCGDRMPAPVCSSQDTDSDGLCDMYGNLWEWLGEPALPDDLPFVDDASSESYMQLIGGSLNTVTTDIFLKQYTTVDHRTVPHSPTRLGFRCFLPASGSR